MGLVDISPLASRFAARTRAMLDKTQIIVRTTHDCGPSLARASDRSRQLLAFLLVLAPLCPSGRTQPAPCGSWPPSKTGDRPRRGDSMPQSRNRQTHGKRSTMGRRADASLVCARNGPSGAPGAEIAPRRRLAFTYRQFRASYGAARSASCLTSQAATWFISA